MQAYYTSPQSIRLYLFNRRHYDVHCNCCGNNVIFANNQYGRTTPLIYGMLTEENYLLSGVYNYPVCNFDPPMHALK